ncbi:hypothetical protein OG930_06895 [Streptomyces sp. NBC_01799]|nr:hypothetical protein OG930_06895 [Streptomyces sp. NBC_01799]
MTGDFFITVATAKSYVSRLLTKLNAPRPAPTRPQFLQDEADSSLRPAQDISLCRPSSGVPHCRGQIPRLPGQS